MAGFNIILQPTPRSPKLSVLLRFLFVYIGECSRDMNLATEGVKNAWICTSTPPYAFMA
jgi:hypothetical protein